MDLQSLTAISPIDGRYRKQLDTLADYFSEYALMKYRVKVEVEYLLSLAQNNFFTLPKGAADQIREITEAFSIHDAEVIKKKESITNHDVKAVEYFIKDKISTFDGDEYKEWVHFGLTSQDVNNTAIPMSWKDYVENEYIPSLNLLIETLNQKVEEWKHVPMLARTHGQPASPTKLGKEIKVFVERLQNQLELFQHIPFTCKFGGATGNFNAHHVAFPEFNWIDFSNRFCEEILKLRRQQHTTQIEHYDMLAAHFDSMKRINTILIDLCRDIWSYVSMEYFKQKIKEGEVGSSAMPHKVNPIDFENAEGNLGVANALFEHLSAKLPISRLQRDLSDSTVLRNIGVPAAHTTLAFQSIQKGFSKLLINNEAIDRDLEGNWAVVAEAIQTILRRENYPNPYEALKELTRGSEINQQTLHIFIDKLNVSTAVKKELYAISPKNYTGLTGVAQ
jgi:adenylosuccinate lyase